VEVPQSTDGGQERGDEVDLGGCGAVTVVCLTAVVGCTTSHGAARGRDARGRAGSDLRDRHADSGRHEFLTEDAVWYSISSVRVTVTGHCVGCVHDRGEHGDC